MSIEDLKTGIKEVVEQMGEFNKEKNELKNLKEQINELEANLLQSLNKFQKDFEGIVKGDQTNRAYS